MIKKSRWTKRRPLVLMMVLVVLPAAGLVAFNLYHLRSVQRDHAVEAAIQRDFQHVLKISEKRMNRAATDMVDEVRKDFPTAGQSCTVGLDKLLPTHAYADHLFVY